MQRLSIAKRFNGPPGSGNGGYVAGRLAALLGSAVEVTLRAPPPLERELEVTREAQDSVALWDGETRVAEARRAVLELEVPSAPSLEEASHAAERYSGFAEHIFPTCFVCGPARSPGDGLCIFPGPVGPGRVAAPWTPDASLGDASGRVDEAFAWAALDCPGAFAFGPLERQLVLGRMTAEITAPLHVGASYVALGWSVGVEGRKHTTGTALFDTEGGLVGRARGTWIAAEG